MGHIFRIYLHTSSKKKEQKKFVLERNNELQIDKTNKMGTST